MAAVAAKQVFDIGWAIGSVAERKISDVQWGLKQYDKEVSGPRVIQDNTNSDFWQEELKSADGRWKCVAQCNVQQIDVSVNCPERVRGVSGGPNEELACRAAKRVATQSTPRGCYPRHCKCDCVR